MLRKVVNINDTALSNVDVISCKAISLGNVVSRSDGRVVPFVLFSHGAG